LKDGTGPRVEVAGDAFTDPCSQRPAEGRHRKQREAQDVMRCRHGNSTRRQHPETKHAAGQCDNIEERLHLAIDRRFDRDEPQGYRIEDQGAGTDIEILQADQPQPEGYGRLKESHRDTPALPFTTALAWVSEAQAGSTDRDGPAEQTDAGKKQRRRRLHDILDRKPVRAPNNDDK
jgi:hypothetical protein